MTKRLVSATTIVICLAVLVSLAGRTHLLFGQSATTAKIGGGFRLMGTSPTLGNFESVALITPDGGFMASVPALACLTPGASIATVAGNWGIVTNAVGTQFMVFQAVGPVYLGGANLGEVVITGSTLLPTAKVIGTGSIQVPAGAGCTSGAATISLAPIPPIVPKPS